MSVLPAIITVLLLGAVVAVVSSPLRGRGSPGRSRVRASSRAAAERARADELEAEREAKYREIRDSELDYRTGKLSREDYEAIDAQLRGEAIAILDELERLGRPGSPPSEPAV